MELNAKTINNYLNFIYKNIKPNEVKNLCDRVKTLFSQNLNKEPSKQLWNEKDFFLITYADSVIQKEKNNLKSLSEFLNKYCKEFSFVHLLPFYPFSSDDGFAVIDYKKIGKANGEWSDFKRLSSNFKIMTDLVINHCSSKNQIFTNFLTGKEPGSNFFISSERDFNNFSLVVRPRSSDLSKKVEIMGKKKYVWCTFSHDQIDFNFKNPEVLFFFLEIIKFYLDKGAKALRLDAVAFLWKEKAQSVLIYLKLTLL